MLEALPSVPNKGGCTVRYVSILAKKYGTLVRYALMMVRVRYVGTLFDVRTKRTNVPYLALSTR